MRVTLTSRLRRDGKLHRPGETLGLPDGLARKLLAERRATVAPPEAVEEGGAREAAEGAEKRAPAAPEEPPAEAPPAKGKGRAKG